jgi:glycine/D-amino acid oxidase-like deaminating enzyme
MPELNALEQLPKIRRDQQSPIGTSGERVAVIGAGIGGVITALKLADSGYGVVLLDAGNDIMQATTKNNGQNIHLGFQYPLDTTGESARKCMETAIQFQREYENFAGKARNVFIAREGSLVNAEQYRAYCEQLRRLYRDMVTQSPDNEVFGTPENFFTELTADDTPYANWEAIQAGFKTSEKVIDLDALRGYFRGKLSTSKEITVLLGARVLAIDNSGPGNQFTLSAESVRDGGTLALPIRAHQLVNAGWVHSYELGQSQRRNETSDKTFRQKPVLKIQLDNPVPSSLVLSGPFTAVTDIGGGKQVVLASPSHECIITQEQATAAVHNASTLDSGPEVDEIIASILGITGRFFPAFANAERSAELYRGYIMTEGDVEHLQRQSAVHRRGGEWGCVSSVGSYHELHTGKLTGAVGAAEQAVQAAKEYSRANLRIYAVDTSGRDR